MNVSTELIERRWRSHLKTCAKYKISPLSRGDIRELFSYSSGKCDYCGVTLVEKDAPPYFLVPSIDHKISLFSGGENIFQNLCVCCYGCNLIKGTMSAETYKEVVAALRTYGGDGLFLRVAREMFYARFADKLWREEQGVSHD